MGIDAKIGAKIKSRTRPSPEQLKDWSADMVCALGAKHFFFNIEGRLALDLCERFYAEKYPEEHRAEDVGKVWQTDATPLEAGEGEWILEASVHTRYYGKGYERGDILFLSALAEWFESYFPGCEVFYGGDSSGVEFVPFTAEARTELKRHLFSSNGRDYFNSFGDSFGGGISPPRCGICPSKSRFRQYGFGRDGQYAAIHCPACGISWKTENRGETWTEENEQ